MDGEDQEFSKRKLKKKTVMVWLLTKLSYGGTGQA